MQPIPSKLSIGSIPDDISGHGSFSNSSQNEYDVNPDKDAEFTSIQTSKQILDNSDSNQSKPTIQSLDNKANELSNSDSSYQSNQKLAKNINGRPKKMSQFSQIE